jgi:hypothetical protein
MNKSGGAGTLDLTYDVRCKVALEVGCHAHIEAAPRADRIPGEKTAEIDDIDRVIKVLSVQFQLQLEAVVLVKVRPHRGIEHGRGVDAPAIEIDSIHNILPIYRGLSGNALLESQTGITLEFER